METSGNLVSEPDGGGWKRLDEIQQQHCYSCGCSTVYHKRDWEWKMPQTKCLDNIYGDLCWKQNVVYNPSILLQWCWQMAVGFKVLCGVIKDLMLLTSKLHLNRLFLKKGNSASLCIFSFSQPYVFSKPVTSSQWEEQPAGTRAFPRINTNTYKQTHVSVCVIEQVE